MGKIVWTDLAIDMRSSYHTSKEISQNISDTYNIKITPDRVRAWLSENGHKPKTKQDWLEENKKTVEIFLNRGDSVSFLSTQFGISTKEIYKFLKNNKIGSPESRHLSELKKKMEPFPDPWIKDQIDQCIPISEIASRMGVSITTLSKRLKTAGLKPYRKYENWHLKREWSEFREGNSDGTTINRHFLKQALRRAYSNRPVSWVSPRLAGDFIIAHCGSGGLIVEPLVWTGSWALGATSVGCRYSGLVQSPYVYTGIQEMIDFLGLQGANVQYGEFVENGHKPDLVVAEIPGLSVQMEQILTTKNWCRQFLADLFKYAESSGAKKLTISMPDKIRDLVPATSLQGDKSKYGLWVWENRIL